MSFLARPALAQQSEQVLTVPFGTGFEETDTVEVLFHPDSYGSELPSIETTEHATEGTRALPPAGDKRIHTGNLRGKRRLLPVHVFVVRVSGFRHGKRADRRFFHSPWR